MGTKSRIVGSNFTVFQYQGNAMAWLNTVTDTGQHPMSGTGFEIITPLGATHPQDIATQRVRGAGTLSAQVRELWTAPAWQQFSNLKTTWTLITIWQHLSQTGAVTCSMVIKTPGASTTRGWNYQTCTVTGVTTGENITLAGLTMTRKVTITYFLRTPLHGTTNTILW
jgi:hypothetical protein